MMPSMRSRFAAVRTASAKTTGTMFEVRSVARLPVRSWAKTSPARAAEAMVEATLKVFWRRGPFWPIWAIALPAPQMTKVIGGGRRSTAAVIAAVVTVDLVLGLIWSGNRPAIAIIAMRKAA